MLIAFENNIFNTDHITTVELCVGGPADSMGETELYIFFAGSGMGARLCFEGLEAIRLWKYLQTLAPTPVPELELPAGTIAADTGAIVPPDRPWLEEQIEELGQHISETGLTA